MAPYESFPGMSLDGSRKLDAREVVQRDGDTLPVGHRGYERHDHPGEVVDRAVDCWSKFFDDNGITP